jgi:hypothetical protein
MEDGWEPQTQQWGSHPSSFAQGPPFCFPQRDPHPASLPRPSPTQVVNSHGCPEGWSSQGAPDTKREVSLRLLGMQRNHHNSLIWAPVMFSLIPDLRGFCFLSRAIPKMFLSFVTTSHWLWGWIKYSMYFFSKWKKLTFESMLACVLLFLFLITVV